MTLKSIFFKLFIGFSGSIISLACSKQENLLFQEMDPNETGIHFANSLQYTDTLTVLDFEYMFNGGGVAVGDINNDGLQDIYFTGNMVSNRLYLNKGNWKFEDITEKAGVGTVTWGNGVVMVDINQDGFKDIYVCTGGSRNAQKKNNKNLLFINNGNGTFTESAVQYGLAGTGQNIQSAFFDYDHDGDLDVYLLRNAFVEYTRNKARPKALRGESTTTDQLYRNNGDNTFTNVSDEAGILIEGFGLGVQVSDINNDGWDDIYVSNDFISNDLMYINNKNGSFTNQAPNQLKHQTYNGMGNDVADFNNDGLVDIVVLDMLAEDNKHWKLTIMGNNYDEFHNGLKHGYEPQYIRNTLQLNHGNGHFSDIAYLSGVEATDWSWGALFADYDNDGWKDLFITNGFRQDITNLDYIMFSSQSSMMGTPEGNRKEKLDMLNKIPGIKIHNYIYKNNGDLTFTDRSEQWGMTTPTYSNGTAYADLDNDGDLDLITNNIDGTASVLRNHTMTKIDDKPLTNYLRFGFKGPMKNQEGLGAKVYLRHDGKIQYQYFTPFRGYLSSVEPFLHFGTGGFLSIDTVEVIWPDGKYQLIENVKANQTLTLQYTHAIDLKSRPSSVSTKPLFTLCSAQMGIDFKHRENDFVDFKVQPTLPHGHSKNGPGITVGDINGDALEDIYIGGATGYSGRFFIQKTDGTFVKRIPAHLDSLSEDMGVLMFDPDRDGDLDLYISSGGSDQLKESALYQDRLYLNDGKGNFIDAPQGTLPSHKQSGSGVIAADYDRDGDLDLLVGGRIIPGEYPLPENSYLYRNDSKLEDLRFTDMTQEDAPGLLKLGLVSGALWSDYDNDGWIDLIIVGEFMPIKFFHNEKGKLVDATEATGLKNTSGWWNSLTAGDMDNDGDMDYLLGNLGLNSRYHASVKEPLCIYAKDFDKSGSIDPMMAIYTQGVRYLAPSRDDIIDQITPMRARFRTYEDYSKATFEESFLPEELESAYQVCAQRFESSYLENLGRGKFSIKPLPVQAQFSPVYGMLVDDWNGDGNLDALLTGNSYATEVSTGRYDASIGLYLNGDGKGGFSVVNALQSGFVVDGDAKGLASLPLATGKTLIVSGINSAKMVAYTWHDPSEYYRATPDDVYAVVTFKNGQHRRHEFYYGSTYLSQSSRSLRFTSDMEKVEVFDQKGRSKWIERNGNTRVKE